jgi:hypothetical protein
MQYAGILLVGVSILIGLSGCSAAYQNASDECDKLAQGKYPPRYESKTVNKVRFESVPDGNIQCYTPPPIMKNFEPQTTCTQGTRLISIPYTAVETVDVEEKRRSSYASACTNRRCPEGFTDTKCSGWKDRPSSSGDFQKGYAAYNQKGYAAYKSGDYATALRELKPLAEQGNATAQYVLGQIYGLNHRPDGTSYSVKDVTRDDKTAVKWYRLAAEQGYDFAQFELGVKYMNGLGVPKDDKNAVKWFKLAAKQGNADAQFNLGWMYEKGQGVLQNNKTALKWYRLAAKQGYHSATKYLKNLQQKIAEQ